MFTAKLGHRHTAFSLAKDRKDLGFAISRHLHLKLLVHLAEKILLPQPLTFGGITVGGRAVDAKAASASQMGRFETEVLATTDNRTPLADMSGHWIDRVHNRKPPKWITLDMDSSVSPTHGAQEGTAWNGHFGCMCYHPLFVFNQFGHLERCALRPGNVHSADGWEAVLKPVIA
jgi:hypothetical protein